MREFYPAALEAFEDIGGRDAVAVLEVAPSPAIGRRLSKAKIASTLRRAGRKRHVQDRIEHIYVALRSEQLTQPTSVESAYGTIVESLARLIAVHSSEIGRLEGSWRSISLSTRTLSSL